LHLERFNNDPAKWWNLFYKNNTANFFKNRKWLQQEFPILEKVTREDAGPITLLEIGAGAGNTAFPILANNKNPKLKIHACDFSKKAVEVMRADKGYDTQYIQADVWDVAGDSLPPDVEEGSVDVALMVFIFSALSPQQWKQAVHNVYRVLKPGGEVCFRDYGRGDLAQVRFRKGRYLEENFYIRGDGTRVYFFDQDELAAIWSGETGDSSTDATDGGTPSFIVESIGVDRRLLVNRAQKLKMYRCWLQGHFRKR
jgi:tRNAThr (cytosine32-N3)-methyltransferase